MLDLALLGVLESGPQHGYELRKRLKSQYGTLANVSFGSIYPALSRLERAGAVETVDAPPSIVLTPPTGSLSGERAAMRARRRSGTRGRRSRKVYRITPTGRQLFLALLTETTTDDARSFLLRLSLARHMDRTTRVDLLERRRLQLVAQRTEILADEDPALDLYARSVVEHLVGGIDRDITWLDRLMDAELTTGEEGRNRPRPRPPVGVKGDT